MTRREFLSSEGLTVSKLNTFFFVLWKADKMPINIDTTSQQYQNYLNGLANLRTMMLPRFKAFEKLSPAKQRWWLQRDPLMRRLIKMSIIIAEHFAPDQFKGDVTND